VPQKKIEKRGRLCYTDSIGGDLLNEFLTYEHAVKQKIEGKWRLARIGLVALYVFFTLSWVLLFIAVSIPHLIAILPLFLWMLVFFTWRYVCVEYEYSITSGVLTFSKIYNNRTRRKVLELTLRDAVSIAPLDGASHSERATAWHPEREFSAISSLRAPDIYIILFELTDKRKKEKRRAIFYFEPTAKALQICRFYNPSATVLQKLSK